MTNSRVALIVGISGQDGAYLAELLLNKGYTVHGTSRDCAITKFENLRALQIYERVTLHSTTWMDVHEAVQMIERTAPTEIYNLSGQSSVAQSFARPVDTFESIVPVSINILEAMRISGCKARFFNASSGECFGDTSDRAADEKSRFWPANPYAIAKAAAHWTVVTYRTAYDTFVCSGFLFNHESPLRPPRFVTRKIVRGVVDITQHAAKSLQLGDLEVVRDWGWAPEYVEAMWRMLQLERPEDLVIATGVPHRLREFVALAFATVDLDWRDYVESDRSLYRPLESRVSVGNPAKAREMIGWSAQTDFAKFVKLLVHSELDARRQTRVGV